MPALTATAPGKIILFGEHAVVYGQPAIAVPVENLRARAILVPDPHGKRGSMHIQAPDVHLDKPLESLPAEHPLRQIIELTLAEQGIHSVPACTLRVSSTIPVAAGLGSGAAVSVAVARVLSAFAGRPLTAERTSALAYEVEKTHHGTPSGIDNTVITYAQPVYYVQGLPIQALHVPQQFTIVIGDTGIASPTAGTVGDVRRQWQANPQRYDNWFSQIGELASQARVFIEHGAPEACGELMDANHTLLRQLGVSCMELDMLVEAARKAGALGAKLSGGGRGGNMIALVHPSQAETVAKAMRSAGALRCTTSIVRATSHG